MLSKWYSGLSLRTKVTSICLAITMLALAVVAATNIILIRRQIVVEQHRAADSVAMGISRASELALAVGDGKELTRLCNSFLRDDTLLFVAIYGNGPEPMATAVRSPGAWGVYTRQHSDCEGCVVGEHSIGNSSIHDDFESEGDLGASLSLAEPAANGSTTKPAGSAAVVAMAGATQPAEHQASVGRVVVGLSTGPAIATEQRQSRMTLIAALATGIFGAIALFWILGGWMQRLARLAHASQSISRGDFSGSIDDRHDDEIGRLAQSFDSMRLTLRQRDLELREFTHTLQDQVKQRTQDLEGALAAAEDANRAKSLFLANMSHELRTPLNGVIGMVDLLLAAEPNSQQSRYCTVAKASAHSLLDLINDILDFSKIEAGKLELDLTDFDLHESIENVAQIVGERAHKKGLELVCSLGRKVPRNVSGDAVRLRQVVLNLLSNAIKFTEKGEVVLTADIMEENKTHALVRFCVKDSGIGIPQDRLDRLFQSFSQVDASTTRRFGGTGLGLAISRRIVELMGGKIGVFSEEGKGSTFWFTASLTKLATAPMPKLDPAVDPRGMRVLAVDDNATNREILCAQLGSWDLRADVAANALQAVEMLLAAAQEGKPYRFAILDMHLPGADGMQLAKVIKADSRTSQVILISLSSIGDHIASAKMKELGLSVCLTKPALPSQLYNAIVESLSAQVNLPRVAPVTAAVSALSTNMSGARILLAEDNEINRFVASELLKKMGCTCVMVENGREAVEEALRNEYDAILMDCQMPEVDGFEATRLIREAEKAIPEGRRRPIIALTANAIKGDRELCFAAGMDGYVTKPIDPQELLQAIVAFIPTQRLPQETAIAAKAKAARRIAAVAGGAASAGAAAAADERKGASRSEGAKESTEQAAKGAGVACEPVTAARGEAATVAAVIAGAADVPAAVVSQAPVDLETLQKRCMGNRRIAATALGKFDASMAECVSAMSGCIAKRDAKGLAASAHKIKGAAANVSAEGIRGIAAELERVGKADEMDQAEAFITQLGAEVKAFREYLGTALAQLNAPAAKAAEPAARPKRAR